MNSLSNMNQVKRVAGFLGLVAASATLVLPVSAQMKPEIETPAAEKPAESVQAPTASEAEMPVAPTPESVDVPTAPAPTAESLTPAGATPNVEAPNAEASTETPDAATPNAATPTNTSTPAVATTRGNIIDVASASDSFKTLVSALTEAELAEVLKGEGPYTVFAPTDAAFAALPTGALEELLKPENRETLVKILKYHVVAGAYPSDSLASGEVPTVEGEPVTINVEDGKVSINDANVVQPDITATNGVIHAIDRVILPPQ